VKFTYTRTVHSIDPANPYLACAQCGGWIDHFTHTGDGEGPQENEPCGHASDYVNRCPSWGPVDGCQCAEQLGDVPHDEPPTQ
jgi:hypothetical protein